MNRSEYLILGGGTIGCSLAYQLSARGKAVTVLEKSDTAIGAAGASGSLVGIWGYEEGPEYDFVKASVNMVPDLVRELGVNVGWRHHKPYLQCISNESEMHIAETLISKYIFDEVQGEIIDIKEALKYEPAINPNMMGAILVKDMDYLDPIELAFGFRKRASELGASFVNEAEVTGLIFEGDTCIGANTPKDDFYADATILCAGAWSSRIAAMAGINLPIKPFRSEMMITEPTGPLVNGEIGSCTLEAVWYYPELITDERILKYKMSFALEQTDTGTCIIHGTREDAGYDVVASPAVLELLLKTGYQIVPALRDLKIIRTFCGLRPVSADNLPYIGPVERVPGFYLCTGHGASGITMSAGTGKAMSELLIDGKAVTADLTAFSPARIFK